MTSPPALAPEPSPTGWSPALPDGELAVGAPRVVRPARTRIALFRLDDGTIHAVDDACPHEGYPLSEGEVVGCILTCSWHAFRFDLRDGQCLVGDEAVRSYPTRVRDGGIEVDLTAPDTTEARAKRLKSLGDAVVEGRLGQVARDAVRALDLGVTETELLGFVARLDAERAEYGTTHVLPLATDILGLLERLPADDAETRLLALLQPFELAADSLRRRPPRPQPAPAFAAGDTFAALRAAVEEADVDRAESLLLGALEVGVPRFTVERWLYRLCTDHFFDFGHALIYQTKVFPLLDRIGWHHASAILPSHLVGIVHATRYDTLPRWRWLHERISDLEPRFAQLAAVQPVAPDHGRRGELLQAIAFGSREDAFEAALAALEAGAVRDLLDALSLGATERILRFDLAIDSSSELQDGWLDVSHGLTYVHAVRQALRRFDEPARLRLVFYAVRQVQAFARLDAEAPPMPPPPPTDRVAFETSLLSHPTARPIITTHLIKVATAAWEEAEVLGDLRPLQAAARFATSPLQARALPRLAHEALRVVRGGQVPRTLV